jgi:hypothetical protein
MVTVLRHPIATLPRLSAETNRGANRCLCSKALVWRATGPVVCSPGTLTSRPWIHEARRTFGALLVGAADSELPLDVRPRPGLGCASMTRLGFCTIDDALDLIGLSASDEAAAWASSVATEHAASAKDAGKDACLVVAARFSTLRNKRARSCFGGLRSMVGARGLKRRSDASRHRHGGAAASNAAAEAPLRPPGISPPRKDSRSL